MSALDVTFPLSSRFEDARNGQVGDCRSRRRLSENILSVFSLAYSLDHQDVAEQLKVALEVNETRQSRDSGAVDPLGRADLWVAFVDARDRFNSLQRAMHDDKRYNPGSVEDALKTMKEAYRRWSRA